MFWYKHEPKVNIFKPTSFTTKCKLIIPLYTFVLHQTLGFLKLVNLKKEVNIKGKKVTTCLVFE